nr:ATP-binding cassette domain-containing protein [Acuticoccus mangrovi]
MRAVDLEIGAGEVHVLFGPNGSGKSTLLSAIMGLPPYVVSAGEIRLGGERIDGLAIDERARRGIGMAFQRPPAIDGVTVEDFSQTLGSADILHREAASLDLADFAARHINVGFSGGEVKRWEVFKLFLQDPRLLLFDEPESGVDLEHISAVGDAINRLMRTPNRAGEARSALIITHTGFILDYIEADVGHVMIDGHIVRSGEPRALFESIQKHGYKTMQP